MKSLLRVPGLVSRVISEVRVAQPERQTEEKGKEKRIERDLQPNAYAVCLRSGTYDDAGKEASSFCQRPSDGGFTPSLVTPVNQNAYLTLYISSFETSLLLWLPSSPPATSASAPARSKAEGRGVPCSLRSLQLVPGGGHGVPVAQPV